MIGDTEFLVGDRLTLADTTLIGVARWAEFHRAIDGAPAARFLQTLTLAIENPAASLLSGGVSNSASAGDNGSGRSS